MRSLATTILLLPLAAIPVWGLVQESEEEWKPLGKKIYEKQCAICHGKDGKGETPVGKRTDTPDMTRTPWKYGTKLTDVEKITRDGAGKMPKYEDKLSAAEITAVSRYTIVLCGVEESEE